MRLAAQQGSKLINAIYPGAGSTVSVSIASVGTNSIGKATIAYNIEGNSIENVKTKIEKSKLNAKFIKNVATRSLNLT